VKQRDQVGSEDGDREWGGYLSCPRCARKGEGFGFQVYGSVFEGWGLGFGFRGLGFLSFRFMVQVSGSRFSGLGFACVRRTRATSVNWLPSLSLWPDLMFRV
jgi:hypothetical protein